MPTAAPEISPLDAFQWQRQPKAEALVKELVTQLLSGCATARGVAEAMMKQSGTRFYDWVDTIAFEPTTALLQEAADAGFVADPLSGREHLWHPGGIFPRLLPTHAEGLAVAIKIDSVSDYLATHSLSVPVEGRPGARIRRACVGREGDRRLWVIERHGKRGWDAAAGEISDTVARLAAEHYEHLRLRRRDFESDSEGFDLATVLIEHAITDIGRDLTCDLFFAAERDFWLRRNHAARVQYARQQTLGLGWANHDHHTYRASRANFTRLVAVWELLGFECRERYHAGAQAGWGAQVMEHAVTGITTFNDVDLSPEELFQDFAHEEIPPQSRLGTVGLWCGLHGDSFLQAGMHHLECQFDFESLRTQLEADAGVKTMKPFTDFSYLRQAFTEGERWPVSGKRLTKLEAAGFISAEERKQFAEHGALGSHLENLERNEGFKGFNQKGVSEIIAATDARKHS